MGTVYLAEHVKMGRKAALKVMNPGMNTDADAIARFNREAANASRLNHPNVCAIYDFGETADGLIYLAMEFIEGESLTSLIEKKMEVSRRARGDDHPSGCGRARRCTRLWNCSSRFEARQHHDREGSRWCGRCESRGLRIAKASPSDAQKVTKTGLVVGTPEYMSPEQLAGDKLDGRSDIYSLGLVAFNCLTGLLPFPSETAQEAMIMRLTDHPKTLTEMRPDIAWPAELQTVMDRVLARDAEERYQKSDEFGRDISKAVENMPATIAANEGTMVMGAPAAAAALPKTRMAPKGGATAKVEAAAPAPVTVAAPANKSPVMMIAAAAVVIVGIGGAAMFMKKGDAPPVKTDAAAPNNAAGSLGAPPAADPAKTAQSPADPKQGGAKLMNKPLGAAPTGVTAAGPPPAATQTPAQIVDYWLSIISDPNANEKNATEALAAIDPLLPKLSGQDRSNAVYAKFFAYGVQANTVLLCRTAREILASDSKESHKLTAQNALDTQCK